MLEVNIPQNTKVLLTGATGFTGSLLLKKLLNAKLSINAIARPSSDLSQFNALPVVWYRGEVFDEETVQKATEGVEYIFHIAAAYREARHPDDYYRKVHLTSTQLLARCALKNHNFKRFVHCSTVGVLGHIANPPANEEAPFNPGDIYQKSKAEAEVWLKEFARAENLPYVVIRPAAIYGPGDRRLLKFFKMASKRIMLLPGFTRGLYHLIHVDDLTNVLIIAATHPAALNQTFICGNPEASSLEHIARMVAKALNRKLLIIHIPVKPLFIAADICEWLCKKIKIEPPLHRRRVAFFTKDRSFDTSKLTTLLKYQFAHTEEQGIAETAIWYKNVGWLK
jgi:nucleoside-diphosphate-sugar epimerase